MKTLFDLVNAAREKFENNPFIKEKTASGISEITFGEFYACALKIAAFLKDSFGKSVHSAVIGPTSGYYRRYVRRERKRSHRRAFICKRYMRIANKGGRGRAFLRQKI